MKIIDRYIFGKFVIPFLYCLAMFISLYIIIDLFGHLDEILREHVSLRILMSYYASFIPFIFVQSAPMSMLLSTIYLLGDLNRHNEIIAFKASGINSWKLMKVILYTGLLTSILVFAVNDRIVPKTSAISSSIKQDRIENIKKHGTGKAVKDLALYAVGNRIILVRYFDTEKNILKDLLIHQHDRRQNLTYKVTADSATWKDGKWYGRSVSTHRLDSAGRIIGDPSFYERALIEIEETPEQLLSQRWSTDLMTYGQLASYVKRFGKASAKTQRRLLVDLHHKIAFPLVNLIIILVGASFALKVKRGGALTGIGVSVIIGLGYYALMAISLALGKGGILPPFLAAWLANITFGGMGLFMMRRVV